MASWVREGVDVKLRRWKTWLIGRRRHRSAGLMTNGVFDIIGTSGCASLSMVLKFCRQAGVPGKVSPRAVSLTDQGRSFQARVESVFSIFMKVSPHFGHIGKMAAKTLSSSVQRLGQLRHHTYVVRDPLMVSVFMKYRL